MHIARVVDECSDVRSIYLARSERLPLPRYEPGQHVLVAPLDTAASNSTDERRFEFKPRCYTLSAAPHPRMWRITVKNTKASTAISSADAAGPGFATGTSGYATGTSDFLHRYAVEGMQLRVTAPRGRFTLRAADPTAPLAFFAAGIGITPAFAMAAAALTDLPRPVWLFYQSTSWSQTPLRHELIELAATYPHLQLTLALSRREREVGSSRLPIFELPNVRLLQARFAAVELAATVPLAQQSHCFVCGPASWTEELCRALPTHGVPPERTHVESFGGALRLSPQVEIDSAVPGEERSQRDRSAADGSKQRSQVQ